MAEVAKITGLHWAPGVTQGMTACGMARDRTVKHRDTLIKAAAHNSVIPAPTAPFPRRACPWLEQGRESRAKRARNAHIRAMAAAGGGASIWLSAAPSLRPEGARSARFIRWIPAFAGMARWGRRNGEVGAWEWRSGLYSLDARRVFTPPAFFLSFRRKPESRAKRARNAHIRAMAAAGGGASIWLSAAPSSRHEGARSARFIRWIPAFAGMAR